MSCGELSQIYLYDFYFSHSVGAISLTKSRAKSDMPRQHTYVYPSQHVLIFSVHESWSAVYLGICPR
jgi:hypothetical protein